MTLRRRLLFVLGVCALACANLPAGQGQEVGPVASPPPSDLTRTKETKEGLTRTGARRTCVVNAVERAKYATVNIHSERTVAASGELYPVPSNRVNGMGTGIVVDPRGYIVTNHHVIEDVSLLKIRLCDGTQQIATVVARNPEVDLALLKIDAQHPLPVMPLGTATDLMVGETVIAIGNAYGYEHTVSVGVVSATKRDVSLNKDMSYKALIQTDASINPGNSGGPLVNVHGELVGVNVAIRAGAQNIGFAIPVDHMVRAVSEMLRGRRRTAAYDGLVYRDILEQSDDGLIRKVVVDRVEAGSPAESAGVKAGDLVQAIGELKVLSGIDVERGFLDRKSGDSLKLVVRRQEQEQRIELALATGDRPQRLNSTLDVVWVKLGVQLAPVPSEAVAKVNNQLHGGLEVTAVHNNSAAARAGIRKGDVLVGLHQWETISIDNVTYVLNHPELPSFGPLSFYILRSGQVRRGQLTTLP